MKPFSSPSGCQVQPRPLPIVAKKKTLTPLRKRHLENGAESPSTSDIASTRPRRTSMLRSWFRESRSEAERQEVQQYERLCGTQTEADRLALG